MIVYDHAILNENSSSIQISSLGDFSCKIGKHEIWIPILNKKIIWTHHGKIEAYRDWDKGRNKEEILSGKFNNKNNGWDNESLKSLISEWELFRRLAKRNMAPPIGEIFFIRMMISNFPFGVEYCDVFGRYGYEIKDANKLSPGSFNKSNFDKFIKEEKLIISEGAYNDLFVIDRKNIVNGYLIDVRRTIWDTMRIEEDFTLSVLDYPKMLSSELISDINKLTQFPYKKRKQNYQTYFMNGEYKQGTRDTLYRYSKMLLPESMEDMKVLDLGCNLGSMLFEAKNRGAIKLLGIDYERDYITCSRRLAHYNKYQINFIQMNLIKVEEVVDYVDKFFIGEEIDVVFALSLYKHIKGVLFEILKSTKWKICYLESHNAPEGMGTGHVKEMISGIESLKVKSTYLGETLDRSPRCIWGLER